MYGQPTTQPYFVEPGNVTNAGAYGAPNIAPIKPDKSPPTGLRDWPFALLFLLNIGAIVALIVLYGSSAVTDTNDSDNQIIPAENAKELLSVAAVLSIFSLIAGLLMVQLVIKFAAIIINFMLWFTVFLTGALTVFFLLNGAIVLGVLFGIFCLLSLCYARLVQPHIPFAVANLNVAGAAIKKHPSTYLIAIVFTFVQIAWVLAWTVATLGVAGQLQSDNINGLANGESCQFDSQCLSERCAPITKGSSSRECKFSVSPASGTATFFLLVSVYWGIEVFANVAHTTIAGTVAAFWFSSDSKGATGGALRRSCTTSFGSICMGSLLVAIIQALKQLARQAQEDDGGVLACLAACILQCLEDILRYINRWAYVYVGIYGYKFTDAAKAVFELFANRGFDAIINDDLTQSVLVFAGLCIGLVCAGIGIGLSEGGIVAFENSTLYLGLAGFIVGFGVSMTPLRVVDSSIATIFVCFAEDPAALQQSHPQLYNQLVIEWHRLYPDIMVRSGYWTASYQ